MSFSRNILWNFACPLTVNRVRLSAALTVICWHLRLGRRLGAFQIYTIRWRHSRLAPLTVTVTVSVTFRNVSIREQLFNCFLFFYIYLNALQYDNTLLSLYFIFMSQIVLHFLHCTLVLSFNIDVVLTFSITTTKLLTYLMKHIQGKSENKNWVKIVLLGIKSHHFSIFNIVNVYLLMTLSYDIETLSALLAIC